MVQFCIFHQAWVRHCIKMNLLKREMKVDARVELNNDILGLVFHSILFTETFGVISVISFLPF